MEFTLNNHYSWMTRKNRIVYKKSNKENLNFRLECQNAAKIIYEGYEHINLLLSGGLDSEVVLKSFTSMGYTPEVTIFKFENNLNMHDTNYALRACNQCGIIPSVKSINVKDFWNSDECLDYAKEFDCPSPQMILHMHMVNSIKGFPILGNGETCLERKYGEKEVYSVDKYSWADQVLFRFFDKENIKGVPCFHFYTPDIMLSGVQREVVYRWVETAKKNQFINIKKFKYDFYKEHFDCEPRPKLTGFELLDQDDEILRKKLMEVLRFEDIEEWTEFSEYVKSLGGKLLREITYE